MGPALFAYCFHGGIPTWSRHHQVHATLLEYSLFSGVSSLLAWTRLVQDTFGANPSSPDASPYSLTLHAIASILFERRNTHTHHFPQLFTSNSASGPKLDAMSTPTHPPPCFAAITIWFASSFNQSGFIPCPKSANGDTPPPVARLLQVSHARQTAEVCLGSPQLAFSPIQVVSSIGE